MKKVYLATASLLALSQSASAISCYYSCTASACGKSQTTFNQCFQQCGGKKQLDGTITGNGITNCIAAAQKAGFIQSTRQTPHVAKTNQAGLAEQKVADAEDEVATAQNAYNAARARGFEDVTIAKNNLDDVKARAYKEIMDAKNNLAQKNDMLTAAQEALTATLEQVNTTWKQYRESPRTIPETKTQGSDLEAEVNSIPVAQKATQRRPVSELRVKVSDSNYSE